MNGLWSEWMDGLKPEQDTTSALVTCSGKVALGLESGKLRIVPPTLLVASSRTDCDVSNTAPTGELDFCGHSSAITALFEWTVPALGNCVCCGRCPSDDDYNSHSQLNDTQVTSACSHSLLVSASKDLTMKVWDMATGKCLCTLPTQSAPVVHMCPVLPPAKYASWRQTSERHNAMASVLGSLLLAIASDNSTTLVSMDSLERVHVTPPCHEQPVRLSLRRDTGDLVILYSDDSQRCVVLSQLLGPVSKGAADKPAGSLPSISVSLVSGPPRPASESGADSSSQGWANVQMVSAYNNSRKLRVRNIGGGGGGPVALLMDVELMQLYSAVSKLVPEGTDLKDIQQLLSDEAAGDLTGSGSKGALQPIHASYMLMSVLCTWGISKDLDDIKQTAFMIRPPRLNVSLTFSNKHDDVHTVMFPNSQNRGHDWCVSSFLNAQRMMAILVLSGTILQGNEKRAVEVINFYVGKLQAEVGPRFKNLSLLTLAQYWQSPNANLQRAARTLILSAIHSAPEKLRRAELFYWSSVLARCAPGGVDTEDLYALTIVCIIGSDYPSLLPLTARSMAASMLQALISADRVNVRARMVAVELLSRGFPTFKAYLDCQLIIRRLLGIMMSVSEDGHDKSTMQMSAAAAALGVRAGSAGPATAGMGLGIRRVMSGVSMPASGEFGSSDIGSRRPSYSRVHNSSEDPAAAALAAGTGPKAIPKPSGASRTNGSLASTPNNAMSSIARVAITSSAMRAQMKFPQLPPALSTDDDATHYSSDHGNSNASSDDCQGHRHRYHAHRPSRSQRSSSGNGALGVGNTVSFNLVVLAKTALLRISVSDITLINNTVVNILQTSESIRERRGALQLVGLVAQKHPGLLYPFLEGLVATIVQAIEPKHATSRKLLIGAAGAALQGLVRAYPWVSFHPESQCLAVGCIDGRCTAYDLRTATRTAVYDTQAAAPVVAVAISPQGDRVGSFTLGDGVLSIWDPSPSALAMFARSLFWSAIDGGAVPGSSSGTVTPIKTMQIPGAFLSRAEELPISSMMEVAKLTWTADRTLLLQIHDASFSLSL
ncbi:hypothetical protein LPJ66_005930 [Kickxella alabastrina]|uniref:Uncharacterized protein n=1 Tax=Kickxella alabastrina TaxID=61397 RepID=A0ACC1ILK4_9FUNG|nr:hypothetical protein LPJ66_005930 [Kickxella alabastrina]